MNFQSRDSHSSPLFRSNHILRLEDKILVENILFINKLFNNLLPPIFKSWFTFFSDVHNYHAVSSTADKIFKPSYRTDFYEKIQSLQDPLIVGIKLNISSVICNLKHSAQPKLKVYFLKKSLENINEEVKGVILIKETKLLQSSKQSTSRFNINTDKKY